MLERLRHKETHHPEDLISLLKMSNHIFDTYLNPRLLNQQQQHSSSSSKRRRRNMPTCDEAGPSSSLVAEETNQHQRQHQQHIEIDIRVFGDLVELVRTHGPTFQEHVEYNIDLKALVAIQSELEQLHALIGLTKFKNAILDQLVYFVQHLHTDGKDSDFLHTILCGPPGTGKTEIAKILGNMYAKLGVLKKPPTLSLDATPVIFKKVTRSDLIGGYLGQTAIKTSKVIQECLGGCLFIDEAYSLATRDNIGNDSYSKECLDTLCEALSDHKASLMVILAGYESDLTETIFTANRGLESRFIWRFVMDEYSAEDLRDMFLKKVADNGWTAVPIAVAWFEKHKGDFPNFGRDMELLFSYCKCCHGRRIFGKIVADDTARKQLTLSDLDEGYQRLKSNRKKKVTYEIPGFYL